MKGGYSVGLEGNLSSSPAPVITAEPAMLWRLLDLGKLVLAESDTDRVLTRMLDYLVDISGVKRGMIILFDEGREILVMPSRRANEERIEEVQALWRSVIEMIKRDKIPICQCYDFDDAECQDDTGVDRSPQMLLVIGVPLRHDARIFGIVYLECRTAQPDFTSDLVKFTQSFADFISLAALCALERKRLQNVPLCRIETELRGNQFHFVVGHDPKIVKILKLVVQIADADATVLIKGENGTGKELIARAALQKPAPKPTFRTGQLRRIAGESVGIRAFRPRAGRFYRRDQGQDRLV